jgi:hypothetical protein
MRGRNEQARRTPGVAGRLRVPIGGQLWAESERRDTDRE